MPWANSKNKLRESIAKAISEVEKDHPSLSRQPTVANFRDFSSSNLSILSNSANFEKQHLPSLASTPINMSPSPSSASVHHHHHHHHHDRRVVGPHAKQLSLSPLMGRSCMFFSSLSSFFLLLFSSFSPLLFLFLFLFFHFYPLSFFLSSLLFYSNCFE